MVSLDISEFSPDAEDTRANMLLAQLFYHFAMGVSRRSVALPPPSSSITTSTSSTATANIKQQQNRSLEVENSCGSAVLPHHTPALSALSTKYVPDNTSSSSNKSADTVRNLTAFCYSIIL